LLDRGRQAPVQLRAIGFQLRLVGPRFSGQALPLTMEYLRSLDR
jgi:hypothetical protein